MSLAGRDAGGTLVFLAEWYVKFKPMKSSSIHLIDCTFILIIQGLNLFIVTVILAI